MDTSTVTIGDRLFINLVWKELQEARQAHAPQTSAHESYAVLLEEVEEYWEEVRKKRKDRDPHKMLAELVQISAMAMRAATDVVLPQCDVEKLRKSL